MANPVKDMLRALTRKDEDPEAAQRAIEELPFAVAFPLQRLEKEELEALVAWIEGGVEEPVVVRRFHLSVRSALIAARMHERLSEKAKD